MRCGKMPVRGRATIHRTVEIAQDVRAQVASRRGFALADAHSSACAGAPIAIHRAMAAVMALVFLFVLASIGLLGKAVIDGSWTSAFAMLTFVAMAAGVFLGTFKMARGWEREAGPDH
jgi:hypothetical protein